MEEPRESEWLGGWTEPSVEAPAEPPKKPKKRAKHTDDKDETPAEAKAAESVAASEQTKRQQLERERIRLDLQHELTARVEVTHALHRLPEEIRWAVERQLAQRGGEWHLERQQQLVSRLVHRQRLNIPRPTTVELRYAVERTDPPVEPIQISEKVSELLHLTPDALLPEEDAPLERPVRLKSKQRAEWRELLEPLRQQLDTDDEVTVRTHTKHNHHLELRITANEVIVTTHEKSVVSERQPKSSNIATIETVSREISLELDENMAVTLEPVVGESQREHPVSFEETVPTPAKELDKPIEGLVTEHVELLGFEPVVESSDSTEPAATEHPPDSTNSVEQHWRDQAFAEAIRELVAEAEMPSEDEAPVDVMTPPEHLGDVLLVLQTTNRINALPPVEGGSPELDLGRSQSAPVRTERPTRRATEVVRTNAPVPRAPDAEKRVFLPLSKSGERLLWRELEWSEPREVPEHTMERKARKLIRGLARRYGLRMTPELEAYLLQILLEPQLFGGTPAFSLARNREALERTMAVIWLQYARQYKS